MGVVSCDDWGILTHVNLVLQKGAIMRVSSHCAVVAILRNHRK